MSPPPRITEPTRNTTTIAMMIPVAMDTIGSSLLFFFLFINLSPKTVYIVDMFYYGTKSREVRQRRRIFASIVLLAMNHTLVGHTTMPTNTDNDQIITVTEAADMLRVTTQTIVKNLRNGAIKGFQVGGTGSPWRIRTSELDKFIESNSNTNRVQQAATG